MNYCHIHNQSYPLGCYCPYCVPPATHTATTLHDPFPPGYLSYGSLSHHLMRPYVCRICGEQKSGGMRPGAVYSKRGVTRRVLEVGDGYFICRDTWSDGYTRIVRPHTGQMERWIRGAVDEEGLREG